MFSVSQQLSLLYYLLFPVNWENSFFAEINPFAPNAPFLYPLKTSENRKVLRNCKKRKPENIEMFLNFWWLENFFPSNIVRKI